MNRQERRRQERLGVDSKSIMQRYREEAYNEGFFKGEMHVLETTYNLVAYTLGYKLGFGKDRLFKIMRAIYNNIDSFRTKQLTPEDYEEIKKELEEKGCTLTDVMNTID